MPHVVVIAAGAALELIAAAVHAADSLPFAAPQTTTLPATGAGSVVQVTIALAVVLGAVFGAAWLMQRLKGFGPGRAGAIKVVSSIALGAKERAVLVQLGKQQVLLGVAPGQVTTLHVLAEAVDSSLPSEGTGASSQTESPTFKALLRKSLGMS